MTALIAVTVVVLLMILLVGSLLDHAETKIEQMLDEWERKGRP